MNFYQQECCDEFTNEYNDSDSETDLEELEVALYGQIYHSSQNDIDTSGNGFDISLTESKNQNDPLAGVSTVHVDQEMQGDSDLANEIDIGGATLMKSDIKNELKANVDDKHTVSFVQQKHESEKYFDLNSKKALESLITRHSDIPKNSEKNPKTAGNGNKQAAKGSNDKKAKEYIVIDSDHETVVLDDSDTCNTISLLDSTVDSNKPDDEISFSDSSDFSDDLGVEDFTEADIKLNVNEETKSKIVLDSKELDLSILDDSTTLEDIHNQMTGDTDWGVVPEDRLGFIASKPVSKRYYLPFNVTCNNCRERGHLSKVCPKPKKNPACILCGKRGHLSRSCPDTLCFNCDLPGHNSRECDLPRKWRNIDCHDCGMFGHSRQDCPNKWRQHHLKTKKSSNSKTDLGKLSVNKRVFCCNCARRGHFVFECKQPLMDRYKYPLSPLLSNNVHIAGRKRKRDIHVDEEIYMENPRKRKKIEDSKIRRENKKESSINGKIRDIKKADKVRKKKKEKRENKKKEKPKNSDIEDANIPHRKIAKRYDANFSRYLEGNSNDQQNIPFKKTKKNSFKQRKKNKLIEDFTEDGTEWWNKKDKRKKKSKKKNRNKISEAKSERGFRFSKLANKY